MQNTKPLWFEVSLTRPHNSAGIQIHLQLQDSYNCSVDPSASYLDLVKVSIPQFHYQSQGLRHLAGGTRLVILAETFDVSS